MSVCSFCWGRENVMVACSVQHATQQLHAGGGRAALLRRERDLAAFADGEECRVGPVARIRTGRTDEEKVVEIVVDVRVVGVESGGDGQHVREIREQRAGGAQAERKAHIVEVPPVPPVTEEPTLGRKDRNEAEGVLQVGLGQQGTARTD